ncbi:MAG TPA: glycosyltransferase family 4 protein [Thermomicrobiales bacterium]|nr:glycosyltransferase family 4 protein [Thermomicrobiales bacterium]
MRVALLVPSIGVGAEIETPAVRVFAERMVRNVDLHVFTVHYPFAGELAREQRLTIHPAQQNATRFARRLASTIRSISREHRRAPFDLIHALWLHEPGTIAVVAATLLRRPLIASIGGAEVVALPDIAYGALRDPRGRWMTAHVLQRATLVTGGSNYVLRRARRLVPHRDPDSFRRAPLPIDAAPFAPSGKRVFDPLRPHLLHAASLIPVKNQPTLLRAMRRVVDVIPGARLTIAGGDPLGLRRELEQLGTELGLDGAVTFTGSMRHEQMQTFYRDGDLFVQSSLHESQGLVVLEAGAAGVPTVGTAVGVVADLAPECAVAVRPGDPVALADGILNLLSDPARLTRMGVRIRQRITDEYDRDSAGDRFLALYDEAIGLPRR